MNQTINAFETYIRKNGGGYSQWYVGVAANPKERLLFGHNVKEGSDLCLTSNHLGTDTVARNVEQYFLAKGCKGASGGGDYTARYAYTYKINGHTRQ